jgi:hypothetical protein
LDGLADLSHGNLDDMERFMELSQSLRIQRAVMRGGSAEHFHGIGPDVSGKEVLVWERSKDREITNSYFTEFIDVVPTEFKFNSFDTYDYDDPYPHPYDLSKIAKQHHKQIINEAQELVRPETSLSINNIFFLLRCCAPDWYVQNPIVRRAAYYVASFGGELRKFKSNFEVIKHDTMVPYRLLVCVDFIASYFDFIHFREWKADSFVGNTDVKSFLHGLYVEVFEFLFNDPMYNTAVYKKLITLFIQSAFSATSNGRMVVWEIDQDHMKGTNIGLTGCSYYEIDSVSPDIAYLNRPTIANSLSEKSEQMIEKGLIYTKTLCDYILDAPFNEDNATLIVILEHLVGLSGYSRTIAPLSHARQMTISEGIHIKNPPYAPYLKRVWRDFWNWATENSGEKLMSEEEYMAQVPYMQTTRSAGGRLYSIPFSVVFEEEKIQFNASTKALHFLMNPIGVFDTKTLIRGYTPDAPGRLASRHVTAGKQTRAVAMQSHPRYLAEIPIGVPLAEWQTIKHDSYGVPYVGIGNPNDFHIGLDFGVFLYDHAWGLYASSRRDILILDSDGSAFDAHQTNDTMRSIALQQSLDSLAENGVDRFYPVWGLKLSEILSIIWGKGNVYDAYYQSDSYNRSVLLKIDMLGSGEFMTLSINNMTNVALSDYFLHLMASKPYNFITFKRRKMGDDSEEYAILNKVDANTLEDIALTNARAFEDNGHELNIEKTVTRFHYSEYIKKRCIYGCEVPRHHVQYFAKERETRFSDVLEELRSKRSLYNTMLRRGSSPVFLQRLLFFMYLIRCQERQRVVSQKERNLAKRERRRPRGDIRIVYYPPIGFFVPVGLGGIGCTFFGISGTSTDLGTAKLIMDHEVARDYGNYFANLVSVSAPKFSSEIANVAIEEGVYINGEQTRIPGLEYIDEYVMRRFPTRLVASMAAAERLREAGLNIVPPSLEFSKLSKQIVAREIKNARSSRQKDFDVDQRFKVKSLTRKRVAQRDLFGKQFGWMDSLKVVFYEDKEDDNHPHPFVTLHPNVRMAFEQLGIRLGMQRDASLGVKINQLLRRRDRYFPRHHDPSVILDIITDERAINDPIVLATVLCALGMHESKCEAVAMELVGMKDVLLSSGRVNGFSWGDPLFSNFATNNQNTLVDNDTEITVRTRLNEIISGAFTQMAIIKTFSTGIKYRVSIDFVGDLDYINILLKTGDLRTIYSQSELPTGFTDPELHGIYTS